MNTNPFEIQDGSEIIWTREGRNDTEVAERQLTKDSASVLKRVRLRRIIHNSSEPGVTIQFERQSLPKKDGSPRADAEKDCSLSINEAETQLLLAFLQNAEVLRLKGIREAFRNASIEDIWGALLDRASLTELAELAAMLSNGPAIPEVIGVALEHHRRAKQIHLLKILIENNLAEREFQSWFEANPWVFQADAVTCLDDRRIDVEHIADLLYSSIDGCIDLVELKRPDAKVWGNTQDHNNWVPSRHLIAALTQVWNYQKELEEEMDSRSTGKRLKGAVILRPQATLIYGRSDSWTQEHFEAQRLLNSSLHAVTFMTFDQALQRAERINSLRPAPLAEVGPPDFDDDPFADED